MKQVAWYIKTTVYDGSTGSRSGSWTTTSITELYILQLATVSMYAANEPTADALCSQFVYLSGLVPQLGEPRVSMQENPSGQIDKLMAIEVCRADVSGQRWSRGVNATHPTRTRFSNGKIPGVPLMSFRIVSTRLIRRRRRSSG